MEICFSHFRSGNWVALVAYLNQDKWLCGPAALLHTSPMRGRLVTTKTTTTEKRRRAWWDLLDWGWGCCCCCCCCCWLLLWCMRCLVCGWLLCLRGPGGYWWKRWWRRCCCCWFLAVSEAAAAVAAVRGTDAASSSSEASYITVKVTFYSACLLQLSGIEILPIYLMARSFYSWRIFWQMEDYPAL